MKLAQQQNRRIALTYFCLSTDLHSPAGDQYETHQIDRILKDGSDIYNSHISTQFAGKPRYLMADELPSTVAIRGINYRTETCNPFSGMLSTLARKSLFRLANIFS